MAEAHQAVAFSFTFHEEGLDVNVDIKALKEIWYSGLRQYKKRVTSHWNDFLCGVYPAHPYTWLLIILCILGSEWFAFDLTFGLSQIMQSHVVNRLISEGSDQRMAKYAGCMLAATLIWFIYVGIRFQLKLMLQYQGWMYEPHGKMSLKTKIWLLFLKLMKGKDPMLMSYQGSLPSLPLPTVKDTLDRHLKSVRPLLDDDKFERMKLLSDLFEAKEAPRLQRYLWLKSWWATNYSATMRGPASRPTAEQPAPWLEESASTLQMCNPCIHQTSVTEISLCGPRRTSPIMLNSVAIWYQLVLCTLSITASATSNSLKL